MPMKSGRSPGIFPVWPMLGSPSISSNSSLLRVPAGLSTAGM